jgi:hypothetical protein
VHAGRAAGRGGGDQLAAAADDGMTFRRREGQEAGNPAVAGLGVSAVAQRLPPGRCGGGGVVPVAGGAVPTERREGTGMPRRLPFVGLCPSGW